MGVNKDTVIRLAVVGGQHAQQVHDEAVAFSPQTREVQFDEKWSFVGKKEKHCDPDEPADGARGQLGPCGLRPGKSPGRECSAGQADGGGEGRTSWCRTSGSGRAASS